MTPEELRNELVKRGLRQSWIASEMGFARSTVSEWLGGRKQIPPENAADIRAHLRSYDRRTARAKRDAQTKYLRQAHRLTRQAKNAMTLAAAAR